MARIQHRKPQLRDPCITIKYLKVREKQREWEKRKGAEQSRGVDADFDPTQPGLTEKTRKEAEDTGREATQ